MTEQLAFSHMLADADELSRAALDRHRDRVQAWFDLLPESEPAGRMDDGVGVGHVRCSFGRSR